jgi:hypothetical protein
MASGSIVVSLCAYRKNAVRMAKVRRNDEAAADAYSAALAAHNERIRRAAARQKRRRLGG